MSFLTELAPMAGRFTHGSPRAAASAQPPKVAGWVESPGFRCSPLVSQESRRPSWSVSVTGVLVTMAAHVKQIWLSEDVSCASTEAAGAARLNWNCGLSQRFPAVPLNGLEKLVPLMVRVS